MAITTGYDAKTNKDHELDILDKELRAILAPYKLHDNHVMSLVSSIDAWYLRHAREYYWRGYRAGQAARR